MPLLPKDVSERSQAALRRTRAGWIVAALFVTYIPVMLAVTRWVPAWETAVFYVWGLALLIFWFRSLNIDWPRRNFQVREPDPPRDRNHR